MISTGLAAEQRASALAFATLVGSNAFNMLGALGGVLLVAPLRGVGGHPLLDAAVMTIGSAVAVLVLRKRARLSRGLAAAMVARWMACVVTRIFAV